MAWHGRNTYRTETLIKINFSPFVRWGCVEIERDIKHEIVYNQIIMSLKVVSW